MEDAEKTEVRDEFGRVVNMTPKDLEDWLETEASRGVGWTREGEDEAVGHKSGGRIIEIKRKKKSDLTDDDYGHMKKVIGYVHRHKAQGGPKENKAESDWRFSLMNWGHDPLK